MSPAFWLCAATTTASSVVSLGYSVAAVRSPDRSRQTNALYAVSRSLALATVSTAGLSKQSTDWLKAAAAAMTLVQAGDALIGLRARDRVKTLGPALTAIANLAALINLAAQPVNP